MKPGRTQTILLYNKPWEMDQQEEYSFTIMDGFLLTTEHRFLNEASAIVFHMPTISRTDKIFKERKRNKQLWVFWSMECEVNYQWQYEPEIFNLFDLIATYKLDSHLPVSYVYTYLYESLRQEPVAKKEFVNAFISSDFDRSNRLIYLKELMSYINIHSYGKKFNNATIPGDAGPDTKKQIISEYKFSIAFENAIGKDYVTEKFFEPLIAGSVPVYLGAPNIEDYAPGDHCYINVDSFGSIRELAEYLVYLDNNDKAYQEYLQWKKQPYREKFTQIRQIIEPDPLISLCNIIKERIGN